MEGETFSMAEHKAGLDSDLTDVIPDEWEGHSRAAVSAFADGLTEEQYEFALKLAERLHGKAEPDTVARVAVKKTREKL